MEPVVLIPILFPIFFAVMWFGVVGLLSALGGWMDMARSYPAVPDESGLRFSLASAALGRGLMPVQYKSCLSVRIGNEGIGLSVVFPFRFRHPPMTIPWSAIASCEKGWFRMWPGVDVRLRGGQRIVFRGRVSGALHETWLRYQGLGAGSEPARVSPLQG